jgi:hypothetical protein
MPNAGAPIKVADNARWYCKATQGTPQNMANITLTSVTFDDADSVDNLGIHDPVTNNSRFLIGLALGWWLVIGSVEWATTGPSAQSRRSQLLLNGATAVNGSFFIDPAVTINGFSTAVSSSLVQATAATDYVELQGYQDSGGILATRVSGNIRPQMLCIYQGP